MKTLSAIPIREPWIDLILSGIKTWEVRSTFTKKLGLVALIRSGSLTVVATANISEVIQITPALAKKNSKKMGMTIQDSLTCVGEYAWVLSDVIPLIRPVRYIHPSGAVTWVTLDETTSKKVLIESKNSAKKGLSH
jgi:hypothetical protein